MTLSSVFIRSVRRVFIFFLIIVLYLISAVPVGLFLYSLKTNAGINIFEKTGYHSYLQCLQQQAHRIEVQKRDQDQETGTEK